MCLWISRFLCCGAVVLTGWGLYLGFLAPAESAGFIVEDTERDLGTHAIGRSLLTFQITNCSKEPRRIIGLAEG